MFEHGPVRAQFDFNIAWQDILKVTPTDAQSLYSRILPALVDQGTECVEQPIRHLWLAGARERWWAGNLGFWILRGRGNGQHEREDLCRCRR